MKDTNCSKLIDSLENMLCRHGLPRSITSDNGHEFRSDQFIGQQDRIPLHSAASREAERQNPSLMKRFKLHMPSPKIGKRKS